MGKINKQKQNPNLSKPIKPFKTSPSSTVSSQLTEKNAWNTKPTAIVLPSQTENHLFKKPDAEEELVTLKPKINKPVSLPLKTEEIKVISKSVKNKQLEKNKIKRLSKKQIGFKPLTAIEVKSVKKPDRSVNRFLYFEHAEVTEDNESDLQWTVEDFTGDCGADLSGNVKINEMFNKERKRKDVLIEAEPKKQKVQEPVTYFIKPIENGVNVFLKRDTTIYLHGLCEMQVLFGTVEILGKTLDVNSDPVNVYSPRGNAFLTIKNLNTSNIEQFNQIKKKLTEQGARLNSDDAIINCKPIKTKLIHLLEENLSQVLFPKWENNIRCVFRDYLQDDWSVFQDNEQWSAVLDKITMDSKVMLCGGKGVGKSTLLRVIINRLLEKFSAVSVVDLDAGQSEFTVGGCISTLVIKEALLGPNYTHLKKPERCIFIPNTDISSNYKEYLLAIKELMQSTKLPSNIPVIINYMGFTKGLGLNLISAAITQVQPTLVVQMESSSTFKNFQKDLTPENVHFNNNLLLDEINGNVSYELMKIDSVVNTGTVWELQPRQLREMSILAYFSQALPEDCTYFTEAGVKLYRSNLSEIKIIHDDKECDPMAVNANLVSLCTKIRDSIYECYGWGIVRSVSLELGYLTLITPLDESELEIVDHLILGNISLPPSIYFRNHSDVTGHVPYVYVGDMQHFAKAPKRAIVPKK